MRRLSASSAGAASNEAQTSRARSINIRLSSLDIRSSIPQPVADVYAFESGLNWKACGRQGIGRKQTEEELGWGLPDYKPVSVPLRAAVIRLGRPLLNGSSDLPGSRAGRAAPPPLFGLAPRGVFPASGITPAAVRSYRTFSPLPGIAARRYFFCGTFRRALRPARPLAGTLPCGDRTFLPREDPGATAHPATLPSPLSHARTAALRLQWTDGPCFGRDRLPAAHWMGCPGGGRRPARKSRGPVTPPF